MREHSDRRMQHVWSAVSEVIVSCARYLVCSGSGGYRVQLFLTEVRENDAIIVAILLVCNEGKSRWLLHTTLLTCNERKQSDRYVQYFSTEVKRKKGDYHL